MARKLTFNDDKIILNVSKNFTRISYLLIIFLLIVITTFLQEIIKVDIRNNYDGYIFLIFLVLILFAIILPFFNFKREVIFYKNKLTINDKKVFNKAAYEGEISHIELSTDSHRAKLDISNFDLAFRKAGENHIYENYFFSTVIKTKDDVAVTIFLNDLEIRKVPKPGTYQRPPETEDYKLNNILNFFNLPVKIDFGKIKIDGLVN